MPNPVRPSLDAAEVLTALSTLAEDLSGDRTDLGRARGPDPAGERRGGWVARSVDGAEGPAGLEPREAGRAPDGRWALVSALALRHTGLPRASAVGAGARVVPFPGGGGRSTGTRGGGPAGDSGGPSTTGGLPVRDSGPVGGADGSAGGAEVGPGDGGPAGGGEVISLAGGPGGGAEVIPLAGRSVPVAGGGAAAAGPGPAGRAGAIRVVPAPGSVPGLDEGRSRLTVFRTLDDGRVLGRSVPAGARLLVARREPAVGDIAVYATRRTLGLCPAGAPPPGGRVLGVVEAVIA